MQYDLYLSASALDRTECGAEIPCRCCCSPNAKLYEGENAFWLAKGSEKKDGMIEYVAHPDLIYWLGVCRDVRGGAAGEVNADDIGGGQGGEGDGDDEGEEEGTEE